MSTQKIQTGATKISADAYDFRQASLYNRHRQMIYKRSPTKLPPQANEFKNVPHDTTVDIFSHLSVRINTS